MNETPKNKSGWPILRRLLIALVVLATLIAIFYTEENWRGKRVWGNYKHELEAKGAVLDWNAYVPPPVLDDQNFFKASKMAEWFVKKNRQTSTNELTEQLHNADTTSTNLNETAASRYLAWSDQFEPDFNLIREALKRPYARMDGDYSIPYEMPVPNFVAVRIVAQTLAQRARCNLLLGRPDKALRELTLLHEMCRLLESAPAGKPMTLVAAMINVAVTGLYVDIITYGFQKRIWQSPQFAALEKQLKEIKLAPFVFEAFREEQAHTVYLGEKANLSRNFRKVMTGEVFGYSQGKTFMQKLKDHTYDLMPQGWIFQNTVVATEVHQQLIDTFDPTEKQVYPKKLEAAYLDVITKLEHHSVFHFLADLSIANYSRAFQAFTYNQTRANQAQIVCALELYHLTHGEYPETLDALVPQFIETIPHDIIGGQPLHYRRADGGMFLLYSVGWNETDDGGVANDKANPPTTGDWVWQYPAK